jgi:hypothetical protein
MNFNMSEKSLHRSVCDYIRYQYKNVLFNSDLAGSMKLTMGQAVALKSLRSNRGFPDLQIMEPKSGYNGLFIELKKDGTKLYKKNGSYATPHINEQVECLIELRSRGYKAELVVGFEEAKTVIDNYLKS